MPSNIDLFFSSVSLEIPFLAGSFLFNRFSSSVVLDCRISETFTADTFC